MLKSNVSKLICIIWLALVLAACSESDETASSSLPPLTNKIPIDQFKTVDWIELMPQEDFNALLDPPAYLDEIEEGSFEDQISSEVQNAMKAASDDPYQQALVSTRVIEEFDGQAVRIPGYVVPLVFNDRQTITQFFLVPYFGACIHVPPPPPNQIILVNAPQGIQVEVLYDPFWISGVMNTTITKNELATSAYSVEMHHYEAYTEFLN